MLKICLVDDKTYGIPQVIYAIPESIEYEFYFYSSIVYIENINYDIVLLDYYLDKDNKTALDIIDRFKGNIIIGFSSEDSKNELIIQSGGYFKACKLRNTNKNEELKKIFELIL